MALTTVSSERLSTNVKNTNFTSAEKQDLTDDIKPLLGSSGGGSKNKIINGAMEVAQRGTSTTTGTGGYYTIDRYLTSFTGADEALTISQSDVASGTTPYTLGFRKALKFLNGNQTSGAGAGDFAQVQTRLEAQDIAKSGWNYISASSYVTLSFWVKSSVAQNFYVYLRTVDGTSQAYTIETGSLSADTWTKVTKTISGNSNLQFDNNNDQGLQIVFAPFWGTDFTDSGVSLNAWRAYASGTRTPDYTSTWWTTNDSTFEITGLQLEVGNVATDFDHRTFGQELALCQRYHYVLCEGNDKSLGNGTYYISNAVFCPVHFPVTMRSTPSMTVASDPGDSINYYAWYRNNGANLEKGDNWSFITAGVAGGEIYDPAASGTGGQSCFGRTANANAKVSFSAEL